MAIMTNDAVLIQYADGPAHTALLRATWERHNAYTLAHGYDFWWLCGYRDPALMWPRWELILRAIQLGYKYVFWLDADAVIVNMAADLRDALPEDKHFGLLYGRVPGGEPVHWNAGVMYIRSDPIMERFIEGMVSSTPRAYSPLPHWWGDTAGDQYVLNRLLAEHPMFTADFMHPLDRKWNTIYGYENGTVPNVLHLAGTPDMGRRLAIIKQTIAEN